MSDCHTIQVFWKLLNFISTISWSLLPLDFTSLTRSSSFGRHWTAFISLWQESSLMLSRDLNSDSVFPADVQVHSKSTVHIYSKDLCLQSCNFLQNKASSTFSSWSECLLKIINKMSRVVLSFVSQTYILCWLIINSKTKLLALYWSKYISFF